MANHGEHRYLTTVLAQLITRPGESLSIDELLRACGDRAIGGFLLVLAAPNILPLPPGSASILSIPIMFLTAQLAFGRRVLWLPRRVLDHRFSRSSFQSMAGWLLPQLAKVERLLKPRLSFMLGIMQDRLIGLVCLLLAAFMFLPIPLGNVLPAMAMTAFALGLMERDGLLVIIGCLITAVCVVLFGTLFNSLWRFLQQVPGVVLGA